MHLMLQQLIFVVPPLTTYYGFGQGFHDVAYYCYSTLNSIFVHLVMELTSYQECPKLALPSNLYILDRLDSHLHFLQWWRLMMKMDGSSCYYYYYLDLPYDEENVANNEPVKCYKDGLDQHHVQTD